MEPIEQLEFFKGAVKHGTLSQALWEVLSSPELCKRGNHEYHAKDAILRAMVAVNEPIRIRLRKASDLAESMKFYDAREVGHLLELRALLKGE